MLVDDVRARITAAVKAKNDVARDVLRLVLGEIQTAEARANRALRDEETVAIVRKLVKSNEETLALSAEAQAAALRRENEVLAALLPETLGVPALVEALEPQREAIRAAKNDGQATGLAVKHLKTTSAVFEGSDVSAAVKLMRGA